MPVLCVLSMVGGRYKQQTVVTAGTGAVIVAFSIQIWAMAPSVGALDSPDLGLSPGSRSAY